jgi:hypothetical protein
VRSCDYACWATAPTLAGTHLDFELVDIALKVTTVRLSKFDLLAITLNADGAGTRNQPMQRITGFLQLGLG